MGERESLILPHEAILSQRSLALSSQSPSVASRREFFKDDILVKIRSMRSAGHLTLTEESSSAYTMKECAICCEDYVKGDDIAWSKNELCFHAYHTKCILEWLMNHSECPMVSRKNLKSSS